METVVLDWLNLVIRWTHVIAGIAWIGSSFFFMWLDAHLEQPAPDKKEVEGELWMVHSGGFYEVNKIQVAPTELPRTLHWFKWEAYFTGITGVLLLAIVYYLGAEAFLIDVEVVDLTRLEAIGIGVGTLVVGWFAYDGLFASSFGRVCSAPDFDAELDSNADCVIGLPEHELLTSTFSGPPGPSGLACAGSVPCEAK